MRKRTSFLLGIFSLLTIVSQPFIAQAAVFANDGSYWWASGGDWKKIYNDGYCINGRGPCLSNIWYLRWTWNHSGCHADESAYWDWPREYELYANGKVSAWIDSVTGNMYGADYLVTYNYASSYWSTVNQSRYYDAWAPVSSWLYRPSNLRLTDGWGSQYICNGVGGLQVEFDEIMLAY